MRTLLDVDPDDQRECSRRRRTGGHASALGPARRRRPDRHEVRLRHLCLRRLHGALGRSADPLLHHSGGGGRRQAEHPHRGHRRHAGRAGVGAEGVDPSPTSFVPNAYVRVGSDERVTLIVAQVEMGQGVYTSMPMILAEELDVGLDQVQIELAPPDDSLYTNPLLGDQETGASSSVRVFYLPLRRAGAAARSMLVAAAAEQWSVDPSSCRTERGVVTHSPTGRASSYGALAARAAKLPAPPEVALKDRKDFRLVGTPANRLA